MLLNSWLKKLTARFGRAPVRPCRRNACRLTLEPLESRLAPAVHIWTGAPNGLWSLSSNWSGGAPTIAETGIQLVFPASTSVDNIAGLVVDRISFTAGSSVVLSTPLALNGSAAGDHVVAGNGVAVLFSGAAITLAGTQVQFNTGLNGSVTIQNSLTGPSGFRMVGAGLLQLQGTANYQGITQINSGTMVLKNAGNANSTLSGSSITVGDDVGENLSAELRLDSSNQLPDTTPITVRREGRLNLNGAAEGIGALTLSAGQVSMGGGELFLGGNVTALAQQTTSLIRGSINLGAGDRTFTVSNGSLEPTFLVIDGEITGSGGLIKDGPGILQLNGSIANSYTGTTTVKEGVLALRTNTPDAGLSRTIVIGDDVGAAESAVLLLVGSTEIPNAASVTVKGDGLLDMLADLVEDISSLTLGSPVGGGQVRTTGASVLRIVPGGSIAVNAAPTASRMRGTAFLDLAANTLISVANAADTLAIEMRISGAGGLIKDGPGTLELAGTIANTYTGTTTVKDGVLALNSAAVNATVSKALVIGDSTGAAASAVVRVMRINQIPNDGTVTIHLDGRLDLIGQLEIIAVLTLDGGSSVTTGPAADFLLPDNDVIVTGVGASSPATVAGRLRLNNSGNRFIVADGAADVDLQVDAVVVFGGLIKDGPGRLVLTGANLYTGATIMNAGVLQVDGSQPTSAVSLTGGTLAGSGTVGPITATGGTLAPGLLTATVPVALKSGNLALGAATFAPLISGTPGGAADQLVVTGTVNLTGARLVPIQTGSGAAVGQTFRVINNDGADPVVGTFVGLPEGASLPVNGQTFVITYHGGDGNDVVLNRVANVIVTGPDAGAAPRVRVFDAETQTQKFNFLAYPATFKGGVRVATADVNGDGFPDIITAPGPGTAALVKVFSGATQPGQTPQLLHVLRPYGNFKGGAFVAAGDVNGDGVPDIVVGPGSTRAPTVVVFSGASGTRVTSLSAFPASFKGGVTVAAGDVNGDGKIDIIAGMGSGSQPRVRVFDAGTPTQLAGAIGSFLAYPNSFKGGVFVAAGDLNGDGSANVITGPGVGFTPFVKVFTPPTVTAPRQILAHPPGQKRGVRVGSADINGDGRADILTALGPQGRSEVRGFGLASVSAIDSFFAEGGAFKLGMFVAGGH